MVKVHPPEVDMCGARSFCSTPAHASGQRVNGIKKNRDIHSGPD